MEYIEFIAAAIAAIFIVVAVLKQGIPWLAGNGSRYIPLLTLALGIVVAVYAGGHYGLSWLEVLITAVLPALGSSGVNSVKNNIMS